MLVREVKEIARQWVQEEAVNLPGFYGAFFIGSINWMDDDAAFPLTSDVDIMIALENYNEYPEYKKVRYQNIILEIATKSKEEVKDAETVLSNYRYAAHFTRPNIILDPTDHLSRIRTVVSKEYARRKWVHKRVVDAHTWALISSERVATLTEQVHHTFPWLYPVTILGHVPLIADLQNPTVRKSLVAGRAVLERYDQLAIHESILDILGSTHMNHEIVEAHLVSCIEMFNVAKDYVKTPFFQSTLISEDTRSIAIDGSREIIGMGYHREAMAWIAFIQLLCQKALDNDAPKEVQQQFAPAFGRMLADLGVATAADRQQRIEQIKQLGPPLMEVAETIIANNPNILE